VPHSGLRRGLEPSGPEAAASPAAIPTVAVNGHFNNGHRKTLEDVAV